jgi:hypothetical protein
MAPSCARPRLAAPAGRGCSSVGRAPQSHCGGQGFKSPQLHQTNQVFFAFSPRISWTGKRRVSTRIDLIAHHDPEIAVAYPRQKRAAYAKKAGIALIRGRPPECQFVADPPSREAADASDIPRSEPMPQPGLRPGSTAVYPPPMVAMWAPKAILWPVDFKTYSRGSW